MALVIGTDSYCTLAEANTYVSANFATTDAKYIGWAALSDANKEVYLRRATKSIDRQIFRGIKAVESQTLEFPRAFYVNDTYNRNIGLTIDNVHGEGWYVETSVKQQIKDAEVEEALGILLNGDISNKRAELQLQGVKSMSLGNLSESYSGNKFVSSNLLSLTAREYLGYAINGGIVI